MHSLTSALDRCEWSVSRPGHFTPRERASATDWIGGWMGPRDGLDTVMNRNIPSPCHNLNPQSSSLQPSTTSLNYGKQLMSDLSSLL